MYGSLAAPSLGLLAEGTYPAEKPNHKHASSSESEHAPYIFIGHTKCNTYIVIYNLVAAGGGFVQMD